MKPDTTKRGRWVNELLIHWNSNMFTCMVYDVWFVLFHLCSINSRCCYFKERIFFHSNFRHFLLSRWWHFQYTNNHRVFVCSTTPKHCQFGLDLILQLFPFLSINLQPCQFLNLFQDFDNFRHTFVTTDIKKGIKPTIIVRPSVFQTLVSYLIRMRPAFLYRFHHWIYSYHYASLVSSFYYLYVCERSQ